jgi:hypothetical protein
VAGDVANLTGDGINNVTASLGGTTPIDPSLQSPVQPECDHSPEPVAILGQQRSPVGMLATRRAFQQPNGFARIAVHHQALTDCLRLIRSSAQFP